MGSRYRWKVRVHAVCNRGVIARPFAMRARARGHWLSTGLRGGVAAVGIFPRRMADPAVEDAGLGPFCVGLPGPLGTLRLCSRPWLGPGPPSGLLPQQPRRLLFVEVRLHRLKKVVED